MGRRGPIFRSRVYATMCVHSTRHHIAADAKEWPVQGGDAVSGDVNGNGVGSIVLCIVSGKLVHDKTV